MTTFHLKIEEGSVLSTMGNNNKKCPLITIDNVLPALSLDEFSQCFSLKASVSAYLVKQYQNTIAAQEAIFSHSVSAASIIGQMKARREINERIPKKERHTLYKGAKIRLHYAYIKLRESMVLHIDTKVHIIDLLIFITKNWRKYEVLDGALLPLCMLQLENVNVTMTRCLSHGIEEAITEPSQHRDFFCYVLANDYLSYENEYTIVGLLSLEQTPPATVKEETIQISREIKECVICFDQAATIVYMPCRHQRVCEDCNSDDLIICPFCRAVIDYWFKPY